MKQHLARASILLTTETKGYSPDQTPPTPLFPSRPAVPLQTCSTVNRSLAYPVSESDRPDALAFCLSARSVVQDAGAEVRLGVMWYPPCVLACGVTAMGP